MLSLCSFVTNIATAVLMHEKNSYAWKRKCCFDAVLFIFHKAYCILLHDKKKKYSECSMKLFVMRAHFRFCMHSYDLLSDAETMCEISLIHVKEGVTSGRTTW